MKFAQSTAFRICLKISLILFLYWSSVFIHCSCTRHCSAPFCKQALFRLVYSLTGIELRQVSCAARAWRLAMRCMCWTVLHRPVCRQPQLEPNQLQLYIPRSGSAWPPTAGRSGSASGSKPSISGLIQAEERSKCSTRRSWLNVRENEESRHCAGWLLLNC